MAAFNLSTFPEVCRLCLQSKHPDELISIETERPPYNTKMVDLLEELTFKIPASAVHYFPSEVCAMCLEVFDFFCKYKHKIQQIHRFLLAFVEVKLGKTEPLKQLFQEHGESLEVLFKDLDICNRDVLQVEDILEEYSHYRIASLPIVKIEIDAEEEQEDGGSHEQLCNVEILECNKNEKDFMGSCTEISEEVKKEIARTSPISLQELPPDDEDMVYNRSDDADDLADDTTLDIATQDEQVEHCSGDAIPVRRPSALNCDKCCFKTRHQEALNAHRRRHVLYDHMDGIHCSNPSCLKAFPDQQQYDKHLKEGVHKQHVCDICGASLKHKYSLEVHLARHAGIPQFQCQYCSSPFYTKTEMRNHITSIHTAGKICECSKCGAVFKNNKLLKQHLESHVEARNFKCSTCDFAFKTVHHLRRHVATVHQEVRFHCERCEMSYGRKDKLRMHMEREHNVQSYFYCDICLRSFNGESALEKHKGHHAAPKPLECGVCLIAFEDSPSFEQHLCISYRQDYICCGRDFKFHVHYNRHMIKEHGVHSNVRVKPKSGQLIGQMRANRRQRLIRCRRCAEIFQSVAERKQHNVSCKKTHKLKSAAAVVSTKRRSSEPSIQVSEMGEEEYLVEDEDDMQMDSEYILTEET
ncbi:zinc finger protein 90-like [Wyeomyia smithii]|uniref:zinc finger protein 90-like n=1 Tax=Wyeomyia smithii TaxID=174621 RepID=UPI002467F0E8|nr:zinc finger protein 90-like [Wyeomyia smithii]